MRHYEMLTIISPELETDATEESLKKIEKLINDNSGKVDAIDRWGKKRLAYEIKKFSEGTYSVFDFQGAPETVKEVDRVLKINDDVLRFMIVKMPEKKQ